MGRGSNSSSSSVLYGTRPSNVRPSSARSIEQRLRDLLAEAPAVGAWEELRQFLLTNHIPKGKPIPKLDQLVLGFSDRLNKVYAQVNGFDPDYLRFNSQLASYRKSSLIFLARVGHRIEPSCREVLADACLSAETVGGQDGHSYLIGRLDALIATDEGFGRAEQPVCVYAPASNIAQQGSKIHYRHSGFDEKARPACGFEVQKEWFEREGPFNPKTLCRFCSTLDMDPEVIMLKPENSAVQIRRIASPLIDSATPALLQAIDAGAPLGLDGARQAINKSLWNGVVNVICDAWTEQYSTRLSKGVHQRLLDFGEPGHQYEPKTLLPPLSPDQYFSF